MSTQYKIIFFGIIAVIFFNAFKDSKTTTSNTQAVKQAEYIQKPNNFFATEPTKDDWPTLTGTEEALAEDILAANYYIVFDGSGSMKENGCSGNQSKLSVARTALQRFTSKIPANANVGVLVFDKNSVSQRVALGVNNRSRLVDAINQVEAGSVTPLNTSISFGFSALQKQAEKQLGYGDYNLVIVTDGKASKGEDPSKTVYNILQTSPIQIHTIGFCINDDHVLNQPGYTYYRAANDPQSLQQGLDEVLAEAPDFNLDSFQQN